MRTSAVIRRLVPSNSTVGFVMSNIPPSQSRDLRLRSVLDYAHKNWDLHRKPKTPWVLPISELFRGRCAKLRMLMMLPSGIGQVSLKMQRMMDQAHFEVLGSLEKENISEEEKNKIAARTNELLIAQSEENLHRRKNDPNWDSDVLKEHKDGLIPLDVIQAGPTWFSLDALLMAYVTGAWTTIETLCGDLWEISLNNHPNDLANLNGQPKRIKAGPSNQPRSTTNREPKVVDLDLISENGFDIRNKMGTILKPRFSFSRLEGIREAYSRAFDRDSIQIDKALADRALDSLNTVRNLITHKDAIADLEYVRRTKYLKTIPPADIDRPIAIHGDVVVGLLKPAFASANALLFAVDEWMTKHEVKNAIAP